MLCQSHAASPQIPEYPSFPLEEREREREREIEQPSEEGQEQGVSLFVSLCLRDLLFA